ncbi:Mechanosensitive ion channel family protein [Sporothrix schenckii 1099-18]|uniref:Mechanosensitive ion channel family protein n=1 Tax=Sporothrix schenckii 1099-18 TaxID=1397361 RepID=A0A0F2M6Y7_SPOSC|nr:Mechanosensitive ion channel family protein [Sporothrix schenckii 1099-18]KJR85407.1 Mechanosensitive ion channel family protein [Sporothrix schenckii 1099-18]
MPASPLTSSRFPQYQGFAPLGNQGRDDGSNQMDHEEADIPLAPIRSNASFGARKANQGGVGPEIERFRSAGGAPGTSGGSSSADEKHGLFKTHDHHHGPIGRRRVKRNEHEALKRRGTDSEVALNFMGRLYTRLVAKSTLTRYLIYVIPVAVLLAIPLVLLPVTGNTNTIPLGSHVTNATTDPPTKEYGPPLFHLFIWFEASWAGLWAGKVVAHLIPIVFVFFCGVVSSGTRKYATVLRGLEIPLSLFFWALVTWLVFRFLFTNTNITWIYALTNIFGAVFVSSAVFLGERAIIHLMSISYHARSFANRIKESKRDIYLLGLMYDASRTLFPMYCEEFAEEDYIINDSIEAMLGKPGSRGKNKGSAVAPMRIIGNVGRFGDKVTSVFGNLASEITGKQVFNPNSAHSIVVEALEKTRSSEALARRIWMSFVVEDNEALYPADIQEVLGPTHKEDADECFAAIDADSNGDISLEEMIRKVVQIGKERKAMANSLKDISEALAAFDSVLLFLVLLVVIFIFLAFFQSSFITTLATAGTALLSLSFVFAVTTQEILGSCIFLFVKHPYDVGDRVDIQGPEKENLVVEKISLLYTVFHRIDKMQIVQVPNIVLNNLWIENVSRSKAMRETIEVNVSYDTTFEDIELLRLEMEKFVRDPENSRDFQPDIAFGVAGVGDCDKLQLKVSIMHKSNWHNDVVRATRRSKFMCALALALKKVPIYGPGGGGDAAGGPLNPTYSVSVTDEFAAAARAKSADEKNQSRLVPHVSSTDSSRSRSSSKSKAATKVLNTRNPLADNDDYTLNNGSRESSLERERQDTFASSTSYLHPTTSGAQSAASRSRQRGASSASRSATDVEAIRSDLLKTQSQKGRRQAGQGLPPMQLGGDLPPADLSRYASMSSSRRGGPSLDLERGSPIQSAGGAGARPSMDPVSGALYSTTSNNNSNNPYLAQPPSGATAAMGYSAYASATGGEPAYQTNPMALNPVQGVSSSSLAGRSGNNAPPPRNFVPPNQPNQSQQQ